MIFTKQEDLNNDHRKAGRPQQSTATAYATQPAKPSPPASFTAAATRASAPPAAPAVADEDVRMLTRFIAKELREDEYAANSTAADADKAGNPPRVNRDGTWVCKPRQSTPAAALRGRV